MRTIGAPAIDRAEIAGALGWPTWEGCLMDIYAGCSISAIADLTGLCRTSIRRDLAKLGIAVRGRGGPNSKKRPESISGQARAAGLDPRRVHGWMHRHGYSLGKAMEAAR
jgi:hypothetical protein